MVLVNYSLGGLYILEYFDKKKCAMLVESELNFQHLSVNTHKHAKACSELKLSVQNKFTKKYRVNTKMGTKNGNSFSVLVWIMYRFCFVHLVVLAVLTHNVLYMCLRFKFNAWSFLVACYNVLSCFRRQDLYILQFAKHEVYRNCIHL